jgi:heme/copper-type cytochrome/quinol oxidase subunit 4
MVNDLAKKIPVRVKGYVRENWGALFIVGFMLLLMIAAAILSMGLAALADEVAVYAYYALVIGVVLQLACFLKCNKRNGGKNYESS